MLVADTHRSSSPPSMTRIMIIRHAEKPNDGPFSRGVTVDGVHDKHELTIRGWQRAGALVRFFAPHVPASGEAAISRPCSIFASAAIVGSASLRSQHTVGPLADFLQLPVRADHPEGDELGVAQAALAAPSPVLISWHHKRIRALVRAISGRGLPIPAHWPDPRFDVVWVLDQVEPGGPWAFSQVPQRLLAGDGDEPVRDDGLA